MLRLKTMLNLKKILKRMIHLRFEKKKHLISANKYTREDFIARRHGKDREPCVQKSMPFPSKSLKTKEEEHYNKFCEWMKPLFLQSHLTAAIKLPPYSKYMKDIV